MSFEKPVTFPERLQKALRWPDLTGTERPGKPWLNGLPRQIFLDDMGDTFTKGLPIDWLLPHIPLMEDSPHVYQFLTKQPKRMARFFADYVGYVPGNFILGTSVTNQTTLDSRVGHLASIPNATRFLSIEPLLGPVSLERYLPIEWSEIGSCWVPSHPYDPGARSKIHQVITGGESGPNARPMHPAWARLLRDQCQAAEVGFFFKQWGTYAPRERTDKQGGWWLGQDGVSCRFVGPEEQYEEDLAMVKVGKKAAGRLLDGREWNEMPQQAISVSSD
jgi:protein gp37